MKNSKLQLFMAGLFLSLLTCGTLFAQDYEFEQVDDIASGSDSSNPQVLTTNNGTLFFFARDEDHGYELRSTDGSNGVNLVKDIFQGSDPSAFAPNELYSYNDEVYFSTHDGDYNNQLWKSDGTENGTVKVKDINPGGTSNPQGFEEMNGLLYFMANDGTNGYELWKTDGTDSGTQLVKDINPNGDAGLQKLTAYNGNLYFFADDGSHGYELWISDGTDNGTHMIKDINPNGDAYMMNTPFKLFEFYNGELYFSAQDDNGYQLYKTDGTTSGTEIVKNFDANYGGEPKGFTEYNGKLYFAADDSQNGSELWVTDGATTEMVKDIAPGADNSNPNNFIVYDNELYFTAAEEDYSASYLYKTDGTEAGTVRITDEYTNPGNFLVYKNKLYFMTTIQGDNNYLKKLVRSDGTESGSEILEPDDVTTQNPMGSASELVLYDESLFFPADFNGDGYELWKFTDNEEMAVNDVSKNLPIKLYPNPAVSTLNIQLENQEIEHIELYAIDGKLIKSWNQNLSQLNLSNLSTGNYLIKIQTKDGQQVVKQIIKK